MTSTSNEATPLVAPLNNSSRRYYFLNKQDDTYRGGSTDAVKDSDGVIVVEDTPRGSSEGEFAPRIVVHKVRTVFELILLKTNPRKFMIS